jgi:hypothetical protein
VRVHDEEGRPIPGAEVVTRLESESATSVTDAQGVATLPVPFRGRPFALRVSAAQHMHHHRFVWSSPEFDVELARTVTLHGRLLEKSTLQPLADVRVSHQHKRCDFLCANRVVTSDPTGAYELPGVPVGAAETFELSPKDVPPQSIEASIEYSAAMIEHDFVLDRGLECSGTIVDLTSGVPLADVRVSEGLRELASTDASGRFSGWLLPHSDERIQLRFRADGFCNARKSWELDELQAELPLHIRLPRGTRIEARVRDQSGEPVAGLDVRVSSDKAAYFKALRGGKLGALADLLQSFTLNDECVALTHSTDENGRFITTGFVPYTPLIRFSYGPGKLGRLEGTVGPLGAPGETTQVELVLRREQ